MKKIDPRLRHVLRHKLVLTEAVVFANEAGLSEAVESPAEMVEVLVRCHGSGAAERLAEVGMQVRSHLPGPVSIVSGAIALDSLPVLNELPYVRQVEASRPMVSELDVSRSECGVQPLHDASPTVRGKDVIVGLVDAGIDFTHSDFRKEDGTSRILFLWDQGGTTAAGSQVPYGREYTQQEISQALSAADPFSEIPLEDILGHGTHVAGIAAGCDRDNVGFAGVAPEADLIVVVPQPEGGKTLARSVRVFEAFQYIVSRAGGRPVAINQSQGMNGGGHSGETVLETSLDLLARQAGVVIVKSAGNEQVWRIHAGGTLTEGETRVLRLDVQTNNRLDDIIELWVDGDDEVSIALRPPGGVITAFVQPGGSDVFTTSAGNEVSVESDLDADETGDVRITLVLEKGSASFIQPGPWEIHLRADRITTGRFDAWIERTARNVLGEQTRFNSSSADPSRTITTPGTARRILTVGSYVTRPGDSSPPAGQISDFSSHGPTRYGLRKPELCAPGEQIRAARSSKMTDGSSEAHRLETGTSMAAPHVTGAAALILSVRPELTCEQIKQILVRTARKNGAAASAPDDTFGHGRLSVDAAVALARTVRFPTITEVAVNGTIVTWNTDIPTTGAILYSHHRRRLQLGRSLGSEADLVLATAHARDLGHLDQETYFIEIVAFSEDNFWTAMDNEGDLYELTVS